MLIRESAILSVSNPVVEDTSAPITEALLADIKIKEVRAIYPLVKAINSGRLTRNYTFYPAESLMGKNKTDDPTGYSSFVKPYGKPVLREHQAQKVMGMLGPVEEADVPMGRLVFAGFKRRIEKRDGPGTLPSKKYIPGTVEGDGSMYVVPAITDPEAITRVLGGAYQTVSIGSRVDNVWESISNKNIAEIRRKGEELPPYDRGQLYEGKLSYWRMGEVRGVEVSFVNVPSDEYAGVIDPDIGTEGIRLLMAEKKTGKANEYNFFDAKTSEKVELDMDESAFDESFFVDSVKVGSNIWWLQEKATHTESSITESEYCCKDHPDEQSASAIDCPVCGAKMTKKEDDDEESKSESHNSEGNMNVKEINLETMSLDEISSIEDKDQIKEKLKPSESFEFSELASKLANGEVVEGIDLSDEDLFRKTQDLATDLYENWDIEAATAAINLYLIKEGKITTPLVENEDEKLTVGKLYGITGEFADLETTLTHKEWKELPETCFVGNNKTIPVINLESALFALQITEKSLHGDILIKAREFGLVSVNDKNFICPILIGEGDTKFEPISIENYTEVAPLLENINTISESYNLSDDKKDQVIKFLEQITEDTFKTIEGAPLFAFTEQSVKPVELGTAFLLDYFIKNEATSDNRNSLVTLVGLVRKLNLNKNQLNEASEAYKVFGTAVLRKFLESVPEETVAKVEIQPATTVEMIPDPVAATEKTDGGNDKVRESKNDVWLGVRVRPTKQSGKHPVTIKEKR